MQSEKIACYTFLPWARRGVAALINEEETKGSASSISERASISVVVNTKRTAINNQVDTLPINKPVHIYGPGDIIGIDPRAIIRTEPRQHVTNFEPNYLPYIEFYEEDFIWRYTPARAASSDDKKLRPWLALIVLKESEFEHASFDPQLQPLPSIKIASGHETIFPDHTQYWAWGHVHVNEILLDNADDEEGPALDALIAARPNQACSRLICPRRLEPNTRYHGFLIPAYEKGRLAGLGRLNEEIDSAPTQKYSWVDMHMDMPYYHTWTFRTGDEGDFEALVRRLTPQPMDESVGRRPMDIQSPGYNLSYDGESEPDADTNGHGAIYLEGALKIPEIDQPNFATIRTMKGKDFVKDLEEVLNLDDDMRKEGSSSTAFANVSNTSGNIAESIVGDPVVTPPIYGKWHRLVNRVEKSKASQWINHLNLDPRQRTAAGFGTKVIQKNQEQYMDRAWDQYGEIYEANRKLIAAQYIERFSKNLYDKKIKVLPESRVLKDLSFIKNRIKVDTGKSLAKEISDSKLSDAITTPEFIKTTRPNGPITSFINQKDIIEQEVVPAVNSGQLTSATKYEQIAVATNSTIGAAVTAFGIDQADITRGTRVTDAVLNLRGVDTATIANVGGRISPALGLGPISPLTTEPNINIKPGDIQKPTGRLDSPINPEKKPINDEILGIDPGKIDPSILVNPTISVDIFENKPILGAGVLESTKIDFQSLPKETFELSKSAFAEYLDPKHWQAQPEAKQLDIKKTSASVLAQIDPSVTYTSRILGRLQIGPLLGLEKPEEIKPILVAPEFCDPMYKKLLDISDELFLPNLNKIPNNSISIVETNQAFIESYMTGLNHEFSRELLWREFLTDQRGSYFRQFWDSYGSANDEELSEEDYKEVVKAIKPIHTWCSTDDLGVNVPKGQVADKMVLVIRGDLLKKYPNTIIYLHEAADGGAGEPRLLKNDGKIITPLFEAKVDPDIYFIGFNISAETAKGVDGHEGYFVILKERTGEIHFGMDVNLESDSDLSTASFTLANLFYRGITLRQDNPLVARLTSATSATDIASATDTSWNDLAWSDVTLANTHIDTAGGPGNPTRESLTWGDDSATMASILYQNPFMMAIHASDMLDRAQSTN